MNLFTAVHQILNRLSTIKETSRRSESSAVCRSWITASGYIRQQCLVSISISNVVSQTTFLAFIHLAARYTLLALPWRCAGSRSIFLQGFTECLLSVSGLFLLFLPPYMFCTLHWDKKPLNPEGAYPENADTWNWMFSWYVEILAPFHPITASGSERSWANCGLSSYSYPFIWIIAIGAVLHK